MPTRPDRRAPRAAGLLLVAALVVSGCSGSSSDDATPTSGGPSTTAAPTSTTHRPGTVAVKTWVDGFCSSFRTWRGDIADGGRDIVDKLDAGADTKKVRGSLVALLDTMATETRSFSAQVKAGPGPDVERSQPLLSSLGARFDQIAEAHDGFRARAAKIAVEDPDRFQAEFDRVVNALRNEQTRIGRSFRSLDQEHPDPAFQEAMVAACAS